MRRSFSLPRSVSLKDPKTILQTAVAALVAANLIAGWFVLRPLGGSAEDLEQESAGLRTQLSQRRVALDRTRAHVVKVENGRTDGDRFMRTYFLTRRTAASDILDDLTTAAKEARIKVKVHSFNEEPVEGSDDLNMMVITGEYEGTYADLIEYVSRIDRSPRLVIIESLAATPQQGTQGILNISIKFDAFVREDDGQPVASQDIAETGPPAVPEQQAAPQQPPPQAKPVTIVQTPAAQAQTPPPAPQNPAVAPPTRPRLPMRIQMRPRPAQAEEEDEQQQNPQPEEPQKEEPR